MSASPIQPITGACVWNGGEMAGNPRWRRRLTAGQIDALEAALHEIERRRLDWAAMTRADFAIPELRPLLEDIAAELESGCGVIRLSGFPVERFDLDALRVIWFGLGVALGTPRFQNARGELMRDIRDEGREIGQRYGQLDAAGAQTPFLSSYARTLSNGALRFHTDRCDIVGLLCVRQAKSGGVSKLCSSPAVHNAMLAARPDLAAALYDDVWRSRFGEETGGEDRPYPLPIFGARDGLFTSHYSRTYIEAAQRIGGVPSMTPDQSAAIDLLGELAERLSLAMEFEPGDMQFLNNHVIYHGRSPFEDDAATGHDRLLLRLWLSMPNARALPAGHEVLWGSTASGALRGGIAQG